MAEYIKGVESGKHQSFVESQAVQCHSEHEIGSLDPGKLADFAVLDEDPRKVEPTTISDIGISETWMNGEQVFGS